MTLWFARRPGYVFALLALLGGVGFTTPPRAIVWAIGGFFLGKTVESLAATVAD